MCVYVWVCACRWLLFVIAVIACYCCLLLLVVVVVAVLECPHVIHIYMCNYWQTGHIALRPTTHTHARKRTHTHTRTAGGYLWWTCSKWRGHQSLARPAIRCGNISIAGDRGGCGWPVHGRGGEWGWVCEEDVMRVWGWVCNGVIFKSMTTCGIGSDGKKNDIHDKTYIINMQPLTHSLTHSLTQFNAVQCTHVRFDFVSRQGGFRDDADEQRVVHDIIGS